MAESMASLNGFGRRGNSKVDALTVEHDSKAEVWDFTCNTISADKWPFMEDGSRVCRIGVPIWRV